MMDVKLLYVLVLIQVAVVCISGGVLKQKKDVIAEEKIGSIEADLKKAEQEIKDAVKSDAPDTADAEKTDPLNTPIVENDEWLTKDGHHPQPDIMDNILALNAKADIVDKATEGDMILKHDQEEELYTGHKPTLKEGVQGDLIRSASSYWTYKGKEGTTDIINIPYEISADAQANTRYMNAVRQAVAEYREKTCIRFVQRTNEEYWIKFIIDRGCYSYVGRVNRNQGQDLSLGRGCEFKGTAIHEIMHALGYFHEQSREDRDNFITVNVDNIQNGLVSQFRKQPTNDQGTQYDIMSVMHYGPTAFSNGNGPTITLKDGSTNFGQRDGLSKIDAVSINKLYCPNRDTGVVTTPKPVVPVVGNCDLPSAAEFCDGVQKSGMCSWCALKTKCGDKCKDNPARAEQCPGWAQSFCTGRYENFMNQNCAGSCSTPCK